MLFSIVFTVLLTIHILCGCISLISAAGALSCAKGQTNHRRFGRYFFYGMTGVFMTAVPLSMMILNLFLFLIALFSYYLAYTGWRFAHNRSGIPTRNDWLISIGMFITSILMISISAYYFDSSNFKNIVLLVFGIIGALSSWRDIKTFRYQLATGRVRIIKHLTRMLGATIAAVTAFAVTNIHIQPAIIVWFGPTVVLVPVIFWWRYWVIRQESHYHST